MVHGSPQDRAERLFRTKGMALEAFKAANPRDIAKPSKKRNRDGPTKAAAAAEPTDMFAADSADGGGVRHAPRRPPVQMVGCLRAQSAPVRRSGRRCPGGSCLRGLTAGGSQRATRRRWRPRRLRSPTGAGGDKAWALGLERPGGGGGGGRGRLVCASEHTILLHANVHSRTSQLDSSCAAAASQHRPHGKCEVSVVIAQPTEPSALRGLHRPVANEDGPDLPGGEGGRRDQIGARRPTAAPPGCRGYGGGGGARTARPPVVSGG